MALREPSPIRRPSNASHRRPGGRRGVLLLLALILAVTGGVVASEWLGAPTRVLVIGDSLTSESTPAFHGTAGDLGVELHAVGRFGSGLVDADGYWAHEVPRLVAGFDPDIVIVEFIGNYGLFGLRPGITRDTPAFYAAWRTAAQGLESTLTAHGAQVYWVIGPPLEDPVAQERLTTIDGIYRSLRAPNTPSGFARTVDVTGAFEVDHRYTRYLPGPGGRPVAVRKEDGTHLTPAGAGLFARTVLIDGRGAPFGT